ncbi:MAG: DUF1326 domain-containing protein [Alphaproteobacteria bacterium]|jgi:hypothetical protein|nr:DUF1326 domain-containing protein [Alphaproteobacteria bacterium]
MADVDPWWVTGTLFENCNCQLLCPAHVSFKQNCDEDPCLGYWGVQVDKGRFGPLELGAQTAVVFYSSPPQMHSGGWTVKLYFDSGAAEAEREALEKILTGEVGGPWKILAKFVLERLETAVAPIHYNDRGDEKRLRIEGVLDSTVHSMESKKHGQAATLDNLFNVIHAQTQFLANGSSRMSDGDFDWETWEKHALFSDFSWQGP